MGPHPGAERPQPPDPLGVEGPRAPAVLARRRAHAGDVGAGGPHRLQVLGPQRSGQRHLEAGGMALGHQGSKRLRTEPLEQPAAVLERGVDQTALDARAARGRDDGAGRQGPAGHALGVGVGGGDHGHPAVEGVAHRAQEGHGLVLGGRPPQPDLHVPGAGARGSQRRERGGAGQVGQVADRRAHRALGRHDLPHPLDHRRSRGTQGALGRVLDVDDVDTGLDGHAGLAGVGDAHEQLHPASTRAP